MTTQTPTEALAEALDATMVRTTPRGSAGYFIVATALLERLHTRGYTVAPIPPATEFDTAREFFTRDEPVSCSVCGGLHKRGIECSASFPIVSCAISGNRHSEPAPGAYTPTAPAVTAAVEALRAAGWTVVAPGDGKTPTEGQVWDCGIPTIGAREVEHVSDGGAVYYRAEPDGNLNLCSLEDWNTWSQRTGARPQETGV